MTFDYSVDQIPVEMEMLDNSSRVWVFQAMSELNEVQILQANEYLRLFLQDWTAHDKDLISFGAIFYKRFIVIMLDEKASYKASGCSIDHLISHVQNLGDQLDVNVMDRENFFFLLSGEVTAINRIEMKEHFSRGKIDLDSLVFNNLIKTKEELFSSWLVPLKKSCHYRFVT